MRARPRGAVLHAGASAACARAAPLTPRSRTAHPLLITSRRALSSPQQRPQRASPVARAASGGGGGGSGSGGFGGGGSGGGGSSGGGGGGDAHPMRPWTFAYAAFLLAGGAFAYAKKGSTKSLTSAGGAALILALAARSMVGSAAKGSVCVALAVAVMLAVVMARECCFCFVSFASAW